MRIFSDSNILVDYYEKGSNILNITFSGYTSLLDRQPFGYAASTRMNHSSLIITAKSNHYYHIDMHDFIKELEGILKNYKKICLYGCGMGGYAALKLSKMLKANTVIVISPLVGEVYENTSKNLEKFMLKAEEIDGEIFILSDEKAPRDKKNIEYLNHICKLNYYPLSYAGHIAYYALKELKLIDMLFMGRGEIDLTKFFMNKVKSIFHENYFHSATVFCNYFPNLNESDQINLIKKINFKNIKISNHRSDKFNELISHFFKNEKEENLLYIDALTAEKNNKELAKKLYLKAIDLDNSQLYWKFQYARFLQNNNYLDESIKYYIEAINGAIADSVYDVFVADWSNRVAKIYEKLGQRNESRKYYGLGLSYDENKTENHEFRFNLNANEFGETKRIIQFVSDVLPLCKNSIKNNNHKVEDSNYIFIYWGQGFENAPNLVKKCLESVKKNSEGMNLVLLDDNNIDNYINIPLFIENKFKSGKINHANYSDILRIMLLKKYGGSWIDATCLVTKELSSIIQDTNQAGEFFAFMYEKPMISSWFLISKKNSYISDIFESVVLEYWESFLGHSYYFYFHAIFYSLYILDKKFKNEIDKSPYSSTKIPHNFQSNMLKKFEAKDFQLLLDQYFVHKLTYKYDQKKVQGSNLEHILNN